MTKTVTLKFQFVDRLLPPNVDFGGYLYSLTRIDGNRIEAVPQPVPGPENLPSTIFTIEEGEVDFVLVSPGEYIASLRAADLMGIPWGEAVYTPVSVSDTAAPRTYRAPTGLVARVS